MCVHHSTEGGRGHLDLQGLMISGNPSFWHSAVYLRKRRGFSSFTLPRGPRSGFTEMNTPETEATQLV